MQKVDRRAPLPGLTALRFFAASYVLLFHVFQIPPEQTAPPSFFQRLAFGGSTAVSCFFILSGFILAYTHPQVPRPGIFYKARFARIYPLYLLGFLLALPNFLHAVLHAGPSYKLWAIPADLLLLQNWFLPLAFAINTPAWTLSCEAFFYACFPLLIGLSWWRTRKPVRLLALIWALQLLPPLFVRFWLLPRYPALTGISLAVLFTPVFRLGEFLGGVVLGLAFLRRQQKVGQEFSSKGSPALLAVSLLVSFALLSFSLSVPPEVLRSGLMLGPYCLLIWALATTPSRLLASRPLQLGGEISYGVYLLQDPLNHWLYAATSRIPVAFLHQPAWILLIYPLAWGTYLLVEKPCRDLILGKRGGPQFRSKPIPTPQPDLP